jgi:outer membrane receptor protein involved in Fe transport
MSRMARVRVGVAVVTASLSAVVVAQDDPLEEIIVTGTRIARPDFVSASPIVTVPADVFAQVGSSTVETALNLMPQFVPGLSGTSNGVGDGQASVDLRGLGASRTLVLVDGRRLIPANGEGVPDLNVIPPELIESVEIITGGASATYGSDAIAGVVNLKLRRSMDGVQFGGRWGQTTQSDGDEYDLSLTAGTPFADGRGSVMGFLGYSDRAQVNQGARDFSRTSLFYLGPGAGVTGPGNAYVPAGSSYIEEGAVFGIQSSEDAFSELFASYGYPCGADCWLPRFGFNQDGTLFTLGGPPAWSVLNFRGTPDPLISNDFIYAYNTAPTVALQMPLKRVSGFLAANFDVTDTAEAYAQAILADYTVNTQLAATPLQDVVMPVTNPYVPADLAFLLGSRDDPRLPFRFGKRMTVIGPRVQENQYDTYQLTAGLRGKLWSDWNYDAYVQFGESDQTKRQSGNVLRSKVMELTFAPDGGVSICGGFNPFGLDSIGSGCAAYVATDAKNHATVRETIFEASMNGPLLDLPAGTLRAAFGLMYRDQSYSYRADENLRRVLPDGGPDVIGFEAADNIDGGDHNLDAYVEALVPLLDERPGVKSLDAVFGYRYSDYASVGGVSTWKAELVYEPVDTVRLRGSYQRAVRAPSIFELYQPRLAGYGDFVDGEPCSYYSEPRTGPDQVAVEALCLAQGVPETALPTFDSDEINLLSGGNPELDPEYAKTYTAGLVLQPNFQAPLLDDLQVTIDWYQINIDNSILFVSSTDAIANCYDPAFNPEFQAGNFWCSLFSRDPATGEIRGAVDTYRNLASQSTSGIDTQLQWSFPAGPGRLSVAWFISWIASYEIRSAPGVAADEFAGTVGGFAGSYPEWKWNLHLGYTVGGLTMGARWRYVDSMADGGRTPPEFQLPDVNVVVPHYDYFDLEASYEVREGQLGGLVLRAGIENLADKDPPIFPSWSVANTDASQYDVLGRRYFVGVEYRY